MPELAEVEFFRRQWDPGIGRRILRVEVHGAKRIFRGTDPAALVEGLTGATLRASEASGKQMLFQFSRQGWLGLHLGMTGKLTAGPREFEPAKHDHLVLVHAKGTLIFSDPRLFGRVRYSSSSSPPDWWISMPPAVTSPAFSKPLLAQALKRRSRAPIKAVLLAQDVFPGVGNWMADEILWQAGLDPRRPAGKLKAEETQQLWKVSREVCRVALRTIGKDWGDPPADWLFSQRWGKRGICPRHQIPLERRTVASRTTAWCPRCQPA